MLRILCKSKITNAVISAKQIRYNGSIGIDKIIMDGEDIFPGEQVHVLNANNGESFTTYVIEEKENSVKVILYGPAARNGEVGDEIVILSYCLLETKESHNFNPRMITLAKNNQYKPCK